MAAAVNGVPVVLTTDAAERLAASERTVFGETPAFERTEDRQLRGGGSRWRVGTGRAVDGPHVGTEPSWADDVSREFRFDWASCHPDTDRDGE